MSNRRSSVAAHCTRTVSACCIVLWALEPFAALAADRRAECAAFKAGVAQRANLTEEEKLDLNARTHISEAFMWENDAFAHGGDRHYTNGMKWSWLNNPCSTVDTENFFNFVGNELKYAFRGTLEALSGDASKERPDRRAYAGGFIGMNMYTPSDITVSTRQRNDRPYVGWLYTGWQLQVRDDPDTSRPWTGLALDRRAGASAHELELQWGVIGPKAGQEEVQTLIHRDWHFSSNIPQGWSNQVGNRLGVNVLYQHYRNFFLTDGRWLRVTPYGGGNLGNVETFANGGFVFAVGNPGESFIASRRIQPYEIMKPLQSKSTNALDRLDDVLRPGSAETNPHGDSNAITSAVPTGRCLLLNWRHPLSPSGNCDYFLFAGFDGRYIGRSIFVQGSGEAAHDIQLVHWVRDRFVGFYVQYSTFSAISFKIIHRSVEFRSPDPSLAVPHRIGQLAWESRF